MKNLIKRLILLLRKEEEVIIYHDDIYHDKRNNVLSLHYFLKDGTYHGSFVQNYLDGSPYIRCRFVHGELVGEYKSYNSNGSLYIHCSFIKGAVDRIFYKDPGMPIYIFNKKIVE